MPNARLMDEGSMKIGFSSSYPNEFTYISATPFSWLEASYKYTEQKNLLYGPYSYSNNQTFKDKGFDLKIRLLEESYYAPEVAIGWNDLAGTGRFSAEYIAATKRIKSADITVGYGWGALGQNQNVRNPFISIHEDFRTRGSLRSVEGGEFNTDTWFSGEKISIYSGIEYYLQRYGLILKVEYDTSNPDLGFSGPKIPVQSRFNVGISRPVNSNLDLGLSFERGNQFRLSFAIKSDYGRAPLVQKNDPPRNIIKLNKDQRLTVAKNENIFYRSLNRSLREESIFIQSATLSSDTVEVIIAQNRFRSFPRAIGRVVRIVSALSPESVNKIRVIPMNGDVELYAIEVSKENFDKLDNGEISSVELFRTSKALVVDSSYTRSEFKPRVKFPEFFFNMSPSLRHQIGGPEAFYLGQLWWKINAKVKFNRGLTLHTVLGLNIYNNFDEFNNSSFSTIPHVRSDIQDYLSQGENNIARLKVDYIWSPRKDIFVRLDAGYLEEMFGGVGGEIYYRPFKSNFSSSLQLHKVKQRDYKQRFDFRDYEVETGHLGFYYDFPKGISAQLLVGKYLAGDKGATVDFSRRFKNGFTLGVFATKTDLSAIEFGEGSFDKGFYFSIPTDSFFTNFRQGDISFGLHPLTKDGGASLNHMNSLYALFGNTQYRSILRDWKDIND